jgi:hypothetical protein
MRPVFAVTLLLFAAGIVGCSSNKQVGVEGKVTYGGEPLDVGTITFIPTAEAGIKSGGLIENGAYKVDAKTGPSPGPHRVEIRWAKPTGKKSKNEFGEELSVRHEGLPDKYHTNSVLQTDIKPGSNVLNFDLDK